MLLILETRPKHAPTGLTDPYIRLNLDLKGNNDLLSLTQPKIIEAIHSAYLKAGADILETNTFNATSVAMADYDMQGQVRAMNLESARLARKAADDTILKLRAPSSQPVGTIAEASHATSQFDDGAPVTLENLQL